jgi:penicillin-binding protein 2
MPFDAFRFKIFTRRVFIVSILQSVGFLLIIGRLFKFQILDYNYFKDKSDGNRTKSIILPPLRGLIKDREDLVIAYNTEYYRVILNRTSYSNDISSIKKLSAILGFGSIGMRNLLNEYNRNRNQKEIVLYRYLTRKELINIEFNLHLLPNISVGLGNARVYKHSFAFSHLLGYVMQSPTPRANNNSLKFLAHPDIKIGAEGIEKIYNNTLIGKHGLKITEVNAGGFKIADIKTVDAIQGSSIKLSFNAILQIFAYELCKNIKASIVLLDITTGEVLIMLSTPSFDINALSKKIDQDTWKDLLNNPDKPLVNRSIQSAYAPGSIFKPITALAALEGGYNVHEKVNCTGKIYMLKSWRHCWLKKGHGNLDLHDAIKRSCNITFYHIGSFIKLETMHSVAKEFSIGENFGDFEFKKQNVGINPSDVWKRKTIKEQWYLGDTINLSIGQGFVRCNALQLAIMMARIASLGKKVEPTLQFCPEKREFENINIHPSYIDFIKKALFDGTNTRGGTSYGSRIKESGMEFSGKTGTAQVVSKVLERHEYTKNTRPHGLFSGFAPFVNSKFSASVIVENGGFGSVAAAPIGKNILHFTQLLYLGKKEEAKKLSLSLGVNLPEF